MQSKAENTGKLEISVVESKDGALLAPAGRLDIDSSPGLRDLLLAQLKSRRHRRVTIDLSAVTQIDSSGIATLIEALKIAYACKTELTLQGLHDEVRRLFEFSGMLALFRSTNQSTAQSASEVH